MPHPSRKSSEPGKAAAMAVSQSSAMNGKPAALDDRFEAQSRQAISQSATIGWVHNTL